MIQCLQRVAKKHSLSIITSIHQPNLETLMIFDLLYVLAKGGVTVFSGRPQDLRHHLNKCDINCNENQIPIEVLMKISANGYTDESVVQLSARTNEEMDKDEQDINDELILSPKGIPLRSKRFSIQELWYLWVRVITYTFRYNLIQICIQITLYWMSALFATIYWDFDFEKGDSCQPIIANSCEQSTASLEHDKLVNYNSIFIFFNNDIIMILTLVMMCLSFSSNIKIFYNEFRNRESIFHHAIFGVHSSAQGSPREDLNVIHQLKIPFLDTFFNL